MRLSWPSTIGFIVGVYFAVNALFGLVYLLIGGIAHARPGSYVDAFYFSVQTMSTIGYGNLYPESIRTKLVVVVESTGGLVLAALATGLVFAKFSRPSAALMFSKHACIAPMNGVPTLSLRLGNLRSNRILQAVVHVALVRTEKTLDRDTFYRTVDLKLSRERIVSLSRAWTVLHVIDETSPLFGETPESLVAKESALLINVAGTDDIWMQTVHGTHRYFPADIVWGARLADVLVGSPDDVVLDLSKFHDVVPTQPTALFPYTATCSKALLQNMPI